MPESGYAGTKLKPRRMARRMYEAGWKDAEKLMTMLATANAESRLYTHTWHYNPNGSVDIGPYQLNDGNDGGNPPIIDEYGIPHPSEGGPKSLAEREVFWAMATNADAATAHARAMYVDRGFSPWVAYTSGNWQFSIEIATLGICNYFREKYGKTLI
jgi:hypothetical protein